MYKEKNLFPSSNSKDYCFSGKRCMVQLLQGMESFRDYRVILDLL